MCAPDPAPVISNSHSHMLHNTIMYVKEEIYHAALTEVPRHCLPLFLVQLSRHNLHLGQVILNCLRSRPNPETSLGPEYFCTALALARIL